MGTVDNQSLLWVAFTVSLIALSMSFFFSLSEITYTSVNPNRLRASKDRRASKALRIYEQYSSASTALLFGNGLVNIVTASMTTVITQILLKDVLGTAAASVVGAVTIFAIIVVFGEIIPKIIGRKYSYSLALRIYPLVSFFRVIFSPIVFLVSQFMRLFTWIWMRPGMKRDQVTDQELQKMVDTIEEKGLFDTKHGDLIRSAILFPDTAAFEVMTPRVDVYAFNIEDEVAILLDNPDTFGYSRIPVYDHTIDKIIGILPTRSLYKPVINGEMIDVRNLCQPPLFIPRSKTIASLLSLMKETGQHMAIVVDEHGGTEGIITFEDIVEELFGDMFDETDEVVENIIKKTNELFIVDGNMNIKDFFEEFKMTLPTPLEYTTVGGWCTKMLGHFAKVNESFSLPTMTITVIEVHKFTVEKVQVQLRNPADLR